MDRSAELSTADGLRTALIHHPVAARPDAPLVVVLHGGFGTGRQTKDDYGWDAVADRLGFVAGSLVSPCPDPAPVTLAVVHGTDDQNIPIEGGIGPRGLTGVDHPPLAATVALFRKAARL